MLFSMQWALGLVMFLVPALYMPFHVYFGVVIFVCAVASVLLGIKEKVLFSIGGAGYSKFEDKGVYANVICLFVVIFAVMVVYLVANPNFKRKPIPEDSNAEDNTNKAYDEA